MGSYDLEVYITTVLPLHVPYVDSEILEGFILIARAPHSLFIAYRTVYTHNMLRFTRFTHASVVILVW